MFIPGERREFGAIRKVRAVRKTDLTRTKVFRLPNWSFRRGADKNERMYNRRAECGMLCADLGPHPPEKQKNGRVRRAVANLEEYSLSACVQVGRAILISTT